MLVQITWRTDGGAVLRCVRADGSVTWQRQQGAQARFFPLHDLAHFAVESTLGAQRGFYGLVAAGWEIDDTTGKGARGPLPDEALAIENLVGLLDRERASGATWTADEINAAAALHATSHGRPAPPPVDDATLERVRER
ncbi:MAG TPA: hypothetical protein VFS08_19810, partial [Gemmatimonadaceae bacterium]|nr:hypothetical protein [Gemmatimonadaceae bacterium]